MGCDIHMRAEVRMDGKWQAVGRVFPCVWEYQQQDSVAFPGGKTPEPYDCRNYSVFAVLANVRNTHGTAPISEPRGLPGDMAQHTERAHLYDDETDNREVWFGDHSHSWLSLRELLTGPWPDENTTGIVSAREYREILATGLPSGFCQGRSGGNWQEVTVEELNEWCKANAPSDADVDIGARARWKTPAEYEYKHFWERIHLLLGLIVPPSMLPEAAPFADMALRGDAASVGVLSDWLEERGLSSLDDVRIVFGFDS